MTIDIVKRLRELGDWKVGDVKSDAIYHASADEIERLNKELARYKYATGVLLTSFNSKWQSRTPAEILRAALEEPQT